MSAATGPTPALSLVLPAYDEEPRLAQAFAALDVWRATPPCLPVEILLVDDGSEDGTLARFREFADGRAEVRVLGEPHRGKGAAVRAGVLAARGDAILFSDVDLSTPLADARLLLAALEAGADIAIGSRELPGSRREDEPLYRHVMGRGFNALVQLLAVRGIRDTQCGFKLFRRAAAQAIFSRLRGYGPDAPTVRGPMVTAFDVEVLFLARRLGYRVAEVPVQWAHAPGSKVRPVHDALRMTRDVLGVRWRVLRGHYD